MLHPGALQRLRRLLLFAAVAAAVLAAVPGLSFCATYSACYGDVSIRATPEYGEEVVGTLPAEARVEEIYEYGPWIRIGHGGVEGWVRSTVVCRVDTSSDRDLQFIHNFTEKKGDGYLHWFGIFNSGESVFSGVIRLSIFNGQGKIYTGEFEYIMPAIDPTPFGRALPVETAQDMTGYLFEVIEEQIVNPYKSEP